MLDQIEHGLEVVNGLIAVGVVYLGIRIWLSFSFALQRRAVALVLAATMFFALAEILAVVNIVADWGAVELVKEVAETIFIVCVAIAVYSLYQSERREVRSLRQLADRDALTNLHNQAFFRRMAARRFAQSKKYHLPLVLLMLDIDNFKPYNDQFGHEAGNYALQRVARALQDTVRADDVLARYGGEEFAVLMINESPTLAAERIRASIEFKCSPGSDGALRRQITVSVGLAALNAHTQSLEELIEAADQAMYRAKKAGKNRVSVAGQPT